MRKHCIHTTCSGACVQAQTHHYSLFCIDACCLFCVWADTSLSRNEDSGAAIDHTNIVQFRRLQVLNVLEEIQQLEGELHTKLASTVAAAASERRVKDLKVLKKKFTSPCPFP
ncbi:hypothetical protein ILYODFUR_001236 [Ilyodon furcidens]|uniref:Uncharacterized protein n=1 Tax=Ilyodon furcidens TaxID=33524 RepID=A0ABV0SUS0_9TELE